jgi:hypothetical protein
VKSRRGKRGEEFKEFRSSGVQEFRSSGVQETMEIYYWKSITDIDYVMLRSVDPSHWLANSIL